MRKRYKNKKCSCALCKPYKRGCAVRWKARELAQRKLFEREKLFVEKGQSYKSVSSE